MIDNPITQNIRQKVGPAMFDHMEELMQFLLVISEQIKHMPPADMQGLAQWVQTTGGLDPADDSPIQQRLCRSLFLINVLHEAQAMSDVKLLFIAEGLPDATVLHFMASIEMFSSLKLGHSQPPQVAPVVVYGPSSPFVGCYPRPPYEA